MAPPAAMATAMPARGFIDQCLPLHCLSPRISAATSSAGKLIAPRQAGNQGTEQPLVDSQRHSSPSSRIVKRPNGTYAHLLELPPATPYTLQVGTSPNGPDSHNGIVHVLPCLTPAAAQQIREDAEATAKRLGGWAPRAVGCCTNDILVGQLSAASQQLIYETFARVIMPYAIKAFPEAMLTGDSLPRSMECFFIIKYVGGKTRQEFGEHTDHTKLTVNLCLTNPVTDHTAGGLFLPCKAGALEEPPSPDKHGGDSVAGAVMSALGNARRAAAGAVGVGHTTAVGASKGVLLRPGAGTAILHHGDVRHAGDRIETGERMQLVAFFYGRERRGNALPLAHPSKTPSAMGLAPSAADLINASWPKGAKRDPNGKPQASSHLIPPPTAASTASTCTSVSSSTSTSVSSASSTTSRGRVSPAPSTRANLVPPHLPQGQTARALTLADVLALA